jgi:hypothetical protein
MRNDWRIFKFVFCRMADLEMEKHSRSGGISSLALKYCLRFMQTDLNELVVIKDREALRIRKLGE